MRQSVRLFWRTARFEILAGLGLSLALTVGMFARLPPRRHPATACRG
jgi:hypothetical protein